MADTTSAAPTYDQIVAAWNAQADDYNQWDELGEDEKIEWAVECVHAAVAQGEPLAWMDDGTLRAGSEATAYRVVTDATKRGMTASLAASFITPLYAHPAAPAAQGDALIDFIESAGSVHIYRVRAGFNGPIRWDVEYGYGDAKVSGRTLRDALSGALKAGAASAAKASLNT